MILRHTVANSVRFLVLLGFVTAGLNAKPNFEGTAIQEPVRLGESHFNWTVGSLNTSDCVVIFPKGHYHLERRTQRQPQNRNQLQVYESDLTDAEYKNLLNLLDRVRLAGVPAYTPPAFPITAAQFESFRLQSGALDVGYWKWKGGTPDTPPDSSPEDLKQRWRESEQLLQPVIVWFHELKSLHLRTAATNRSDLCTLPDSGTATGTR